MMKILLSTVLAGVGVLLGWYGLTKAAQWYATK